MQLQSPQARYMEVLSRLLIGSDTPVNKSPGSRMSDSLRQLMQSTTGLADPQWADFLALANSHHVVVRALRVLQGVTGNRSDELSERCNVALAAECARIERAVQFLHSICNALEARGCEVAVIKSLDHWPDLGSDLDLYTSSNEHDVERVMREEFNAKPVERSWGDRLANKWNYSVPGLPELVEVHVKYLGQTGEHAELGRRVVGRGISKNVAGFNFRVPAPEERVVISALQRVYRHFYFRLCDMIDTASMLDSGVVDFGELEKATDSIGIWPGVATYLCFIQNYLQAYGGTVLLPDGVRIAALTPDATVEFRNGYLRVAKTTAMALYSRQLLRAGRRPDVRALLRLPLLPPLAISALVAHTLTGNDKGIW